MGYKIEEGNGKYQQWGIGNLKPHLSRCLHIPQTARAHLMEATRCGGGTGGALTLVLLPTLAFSFLSGNVQTHQLKALAPPLAYPALTALA